jgi:hypothetical protein
MSGTYHGQKEKRNESGIEHWGAYALFIDKNKNTYSLCRNRPSVN